MSVHYIGELYVQLGRQLLHELKLLAHIHGVLVMEGLAQSPVKLKAQVILVSQMGEDVQLLHQQLLLQIVGTHDVGE